MPRIRFAKVRITRHGPPGAGSPRPLERASATRGGSVGRLTSEDLMAMTHDKFVASYPPALLRAAFEDVRCKPISTVGITDTDEKMERIWNRHRKAALLRAMNGMKHQP